MDDRGLIPGRNRGRFYLFNLVRLGCGLQSERTDFERKIYACHQVV